MAKSRQRAERPNRQVLAPVGPDGLDAVAKSLARQETRRAARDSVEAEEDRRLRHQMIRFFTTLRARSNWSQTDLARRIGTTQSVISELENVHSDSEPRFSTLQRYARALGYRLEVRIMAGPSAGLSSWEHRSLSYKDIRRGMRFDDPVASEWRPTQAEGIVQVPNAAVTVGAIAFADADDATAAFAKGMAIA